MSANSIALPAEKPPRTLAATLVSMTLAPLHAAINAPDIVFLAALAAMLFRPPDLKVFPFDRAAFILLVAVFALRLCVRRERIQSFPATWPMLGLMLLGILGAMGEAGEMQSWSLVAAKWIVPFTIFHMAGSIFTSDGSLRKLELFLLAIAAYLSLISVFFLFDFTSLIYPRFILDESIGIHAERARGPLLQAVANGVCLNVLGLVALDSWRRRRLVGIWAALLFFALPLALLATRTRAVWLSAAASVSCLVLFSRESKLRRAAFALAGLAVFALSTAFLYNADHNTLSNRLMDRSPVDFRLDMYRAGWQMFTEKALLGWGSEAVIQPELERRISSFHPERYLFHNTYLELGVERGLLGIALYAWLMVSLFRLSRAPERGTSGEGHFMDTQFRRLWPVILIAYLLNATAVVMNYQFVNALVFTFAGVLAGQNSMGGRVHIRRFP